MIDSVTTREREVQGHDGLTYTLRVRPYKNIENRIDKRLLVDDRRIEGSRPNGHAMVVVIRTSRIRSSDAGGAAARDR